MFDYYICIKTIFTIKDVFKKVNSFSNLSYFIYKVINHDVICLWAMI